MKTTWERTTFGELGRVFNGNSISENEKRAHFEGLDEGVPYIGTKDISFDNEIEYESGARIPDGKHDGFKLAPSSALLVCAEGGSAGRKIAHTDRAVYFGNKLFAVCPKPPTNSRFVFYYCLSGDFAQAFKGAMAGLIGGVSLNKFRDLSISVPPVSEQQRIVGILDESFKSIATAKANAERNLQHVRALFESHLYSVFTQRGAGWDNHKQLEDLTDPDSPITYGVVKPGDEGEITFIRGGDLARGRILTGQLRTITQAVSKQYNRTLLRGGELLMSLVGQPGQVAVVPPELAGANIARQVGLIRLSPRMNAEFVRFFLQSPIGQSALSARQSGSVQQVINLGELRQVLIPMPTREVQADVVEDLISFTEESRRLESIYQRKLAALEALKKSLLHQAFAGQL